MMTLAVRSVAGLPWPIRLAARAADRPRRRLSSNGVGITAAHAPSVHHDAWACCSWRAAAQPHLRRRCPTPACLILRRFLGARRRSISATGGLSGINSGAALTRDGSSSISASPSEFLDIAVLAARRIYAIGGSPRRPRASAASDQSTRVLIRRLRLCRLLIAGLAAG